MLLYSFKWICIKMEPGFWPPQTLVQYSSNAVEKLPSISVPRSVRLSWPPLLLRTCGILQTSWPFLLPASLSDLELGEVCVKELTGREGQRLEMERGVFLSFVVFVLFWEVGKGELPLASGREGHWLGSCPTEHLAPPANLWEAC